MKDSDFSPRNTRNTRTKKNLKQDGQDMQDENVKAFVRVFRGEKSESFISSPSASA
jgi:hypothetical protein